MDDIERYALDIEKIAGGAGTIAERDSAVDMKIDECLNHLAKSEAEIRVYGLPATSEQYLHALGDRLMRLGPVVGVEARPTIYRAVGRLRHAA